MKKGLRILLGLLFAILLSTTIEWNQNVKAAAGKCWPVGDYWPVADWRTSTPEEQGIDSERLHRMMEDIQEKNIDIHSILIIRHGYLVLESYFAPYDQNTIHNLKSVSNSFFSAMAGIAMRKKLLNGLDQKVANILPEYFTSGNDPRKKEITLRHLLTMTAGFNWAEDSPASNGLWNSQNWVKGATQLPLRDNPGERFNYNTALTHLMSAILTKTSGMSSKDFAAKYLFDPLNINVKLWRCDPQGVNIGGGELFLTPRDMAKFGYLYLKRGIWNGKSIVPADWIEQSVKSQVKPGNGEGLYSDYGYWWWRQPDSYSAEGWGGQRIIVAPAQDLVVVFTSADFIQPRNLYDHFIKPAVKADKISPNPKELAALAKLVAEIKHPQAKLGLPLPEIACQISGKTYQLENNSFGITAVTFDFKEKNQCIVTFDTLGGKLELPIGLDNIYRFSNTIAGDPNCSRADVPVGIKGSWVQSSPTFAINWIYLGEPIKCQVVFTFDGNKVRMSLTETPMNTTETITGNKTE